MGFPEQLRAWRQREGLTQAEAAEFFELTETGYANWEVGRKAPRGLTRTRVLEAIQDKGGGAAHRELARFNFSLGEHFATMLGRGKQLVPGDFDRLKVIVGRLQALGRSDLDPGKPVRAKKRHAAPGSNHRVAAGDAIGKAKSLR